MTEAEWLACAEPKPMLGVLHWMHRASDRKFHIFAASCYRDVLRLTELREIYHRSAALWADATEAYADGLLTPVDWWEINKGLEVKLGGTGDAPSSFEHAFEAAVAVGRYAGWDGCIGYSEDDAAIQEGRHISLIRDIFGNPFRPMAVEPAWLTSTVVQLATGIYDEKAFDRMPILADALQDAGCDNEDVLNHCRSDGPHVRGCWVIDLLTNRK